MSCAIIVAISLVALIKRRPLAMAFYCVAAANEFLAPKRNVPLAAADHKRDSRNTDQYYRTFTVLCEFRETNISAQ